MRLFRELAAAIHWSRISAQQNIDEIFVLLNLPFDIWYRFGGGIHKLLGLPHVDERSRTILLEGLFELQRILARRQRLLGDFQLEIESAELEVCGCDVRDNGVDDGATAPFAGEQIRARRFRGPTIFTPEI